METLAKKNDAILEIQDLVVEYTSDEGQVYAVNGISLSVQKGKTLGLVGETGAGKTTTALSVLGLLSSNNKEIKSGTIHLNGRSVLDSSEKELRMMRGAEVAMIFQDPMTSLNPVMTVGEQIAEAVMYHEKISLIGAMKKACQMLEMVGIPSTRAVEYPHQFSGGMRQRVVIAIALSCAPKLLIADEPTTALDVTIQAQVLSLMRVLREKQSTSMIMITHDLGIIADICDDVAVMYAGHIVERGTLEDIFDRTMHPYTEGLFNSIPNIRQRADRLKPIPGLMVNPTVKIQGCPFAERCGYAEERCFTEPPKERMASNTHGVCCHAYDRPGFMIERSKENA